MTNFATSLKQEISRVARKEMRNEMTALRKNAADQKAQISGLKKQLAAIQPQLRAMAKAIAKVTPAAEQVPEDEASSTRLKPGRKVVFTPERLQEARKRLGFTQAQMSTLLGVSSLTISKWETGQAAPRPKRTGLVLETLALGKRAALARLESQVA
ncbi:helix-turn-helix domain-containing protein [Hydrogenophaga sp. 2FB]|uniref:helix-turn-helix domain-containing protein n=1 Tax=Hydrogenophaga sp. 2FB TaxID=2502187 RepID=UPI0010F5903A|nr:helix-turn-helix domain-containing protein [Hydrogenophaga sp. 2FB]